MFTTSNQEPKNFETILEKSMKLMIVDCRKDFCFFFSAIPNNENRLQIGDYTLERSVEVRHFKCVILAGYDSFASVHSLKFDAGNSRTGKKY
jgi:hypothetical protein